jgi:hypothetical protein
MVKVWNINDNYPKDSVFIGRPSPYGNPFVVGVHGKRGECCDLFEKHTLPTLDLTPLIGKDLVCYCKPRRCHGDSILKAIQERHGPLINFFGR